MTGPHATPRLATVRFATAGLATVGLDEVTAAAALLTRVDNKYVVPVDELDGFVAALALPVLEIGGRREFRYESTYFDTSTWRTYLDAARRRPRRFKVRTRAYVDTGTCQLEVKAKSRIGRTVKQRLAHDAAAPDRLTADDRAFVEEHAADLAGLAIAPTIVTSYRRSTFVDVAGGARVTIDTDVSFRTATPAAGSNAAGSHRAAPDRAASDRAASGRAASGRAGFAGFAVVETKSADGSCVADRLLWAAGHRPEALSKYALGAATLHPDLPANRWHRQLARYVRPT